MVEFRAPSSLHKGLDSLESALRCLIVITSDFFGQPEPMPFRKVITFCYSWVCFQGTALSFKSRDTDCGFGNNIPSALVKVTSKLSSRPRPKQGREQRCVLHNGGRTFVVTACGLPAFVTGLNLSLASQKVPQSFFWSRARGHRHRDRDGGSWDRLLGSPACHA